MALVPQLSFDPIVEARRQWAAHGWDDVADGMAALTSVMRTQQLLIARCDQVLDAFGLTFARYELLALLGFARKGALPMNKASALLQVHPTSVTNAVDRLERAGLVTRSPHPTDGRTTLVGLTPEGRSMARRSTAALNSEVFGAPGFPPGDVEALIRILADFRRAAGDFE
jgi:DNA-binding MarR family transcriptional regulator